MMGVTVDEVSNDDDDPNDSNTERLCDYVCNPTRQLAQVMWSVFDDECVKVKSGGESNPDNTEVDEDDDETKEMARELETVKCAGNLV